MIDIRLKWSDEGAQDVLRSAKAIAREVDKTSDTARQRRMESFQRAQNNLARAARAERFRELSDTEKLTRLTERRIQLERFLTRAQVQGNQYRVNALRLALAQTRAATGTLDRPGFASNFSAGMFPGMGIFGSAAMGGGIGAALGLAAGALLRGIQRSAASALRFADDLSNVAEQIGSTPEEVMRIQEAASRAGVRNRVAYSAIAQIGQARASAIGGDERMRALFANYGVNGEMLAGDLSNQQLGEQIRKSLGPEGVTPGDEKNLQLLLGSQPRRPLAMLRELGDSKPASDYKDEVKAADQAADAYEAFGQRISRLWVKFWGGLIHGVTTASKAASNFDELMGGPNGDGQLPARTAGNLNLASKADWKDSQPAALAALPGRPTVDALSRIGLFAGGNPAEITRTLNAQLNELRKVTAKLESIHRVAVSEW